MQIPELKDFSLVGGTALSLYYGHRTSIDLDLFSNVEFDNQSIATVLSKEFGSEFEYEPDFKSFGIFCYIQKVKVDIVRYPHIPIAELEVLNDIRMYSPKDISAMKINAILGRGKKKDFWDLSELLANYKLAELIRWHREKYPNQMLLISIPNAITYFTDANDSDEPVSLKGQSWESVQENIRAAVREYLS
ncbi:MAG: nucleotidyl transferase AbiEii/AbiGii toxin family protein [Opitutaceae bacterium]|nr:nucleotidyl transferase AbiEii/AbiGii toxin family protein [Cytophagales bacterium]